MGYEVLYLQDSKLNLQSQTQDTFTIYYDKVLDVDPIPGQAAVGLSGIEQEQDQNTGLFFDITILTVDREKIKIKIKKHSSERYQRMSITYFVSGLAGTNVIPFDFDVNCPSSLNSIDQSGSQNTHCLVGDQHPDVDQEKSTQFLSGIEYTGGQYEFRIEGRTDSSSHSVYLSKDGNGSVSLVKGFLLIIPDALADQLGWISFDYHESDPFIGGQGNIESGRLHDYSETYTRLPMMISNFERYHSHDCEQNIFFYAKHLIESFDYQIRAFMSRVHDGCHIEDIQVRILVLCHNIDECTEPVTEYPVIQTGVQKFHFAGYEFYDGNDDSESIEIHILFDTFLPSAPQYVGYFVTWISLEAENGLKYSFQNQEVRKLGIQVDFVWERSGTQMFDIEIRYVVSTVDYFQILPFNYASQNLNSGTVPRQISKTISYNPNQIIGSSPKAIFFVQSLDYQELSNRVKFLIEQTSGTATQVGFKLTITQDNDWDDIAGIVIITYQDHNEHSIETFTFTDTINSSEKDEIEIDPEFRYPAPPIVIPGFYGLDYPSQNPSSIRVHILPSQLLATEPGYYKPNVLIEHSRSGQDYFVNVITICNEINPLNCRIIPSSNDPGVARKVRVYGDPSWQYVTLFVTQQGDLQETFEFATPLNSDGRIIFAATITQDSKHSAFFELPAINYGQLQQAFTIAEGVLTTLDYNIAGYNSFFSGFDIDISPVHSGISQLIYSGPILSSSAQNYKTVLIHRTLQPDITQAMSCSIQVIFKGHIQALYANSKLMLQDSSIYTDGDFKTSVSPTKVYLSPGEGILLSIFGYQLYLDGVEAVDCIKNFDEDILDPAPVFSHYIFDQKFPSQNFQQASSNLGCGSGCQSCLIPQSCLSCGTQYQSIHECSDFSCDTEYFIAPNTVLQCDAVIRSSGIALSETVYDKATGKLVFNYDLIQAFSRPQTLKVLVVAHSRTPKLRFSPYPNYDYNDEQVLIEPIFYQEDIVIGSNIPRSTIQKQIDIRLLTNVTTPKFHVQIFAIRENSALQVIRDQIADIKEDSFELITLGPQTHVQSNLYSYYIFAKCSSPTCLFEVSGDGLITFKISERLHNVADFSLSPGLFTITTDQIALNQVQLIEIQIENSQQFAFQMTDFDAYWAPDFVMLQEEVSFTTVDIAINSNYSCPIITNQGYLSLTPSTSEVISYATGPFTYQWSSFPDISNAFSYDGDNLIIQLDLITPSQPIEVQTKASGSDFIGWQKTILEVEQAEAPVSLITKVFPRAGPYFLSSQIEIICSGLDNSGSDYFFEYYWVNVSTTQEAILVTNQTDSTMTFYPNISGIQCGTIDVCCRAIRICSAVLVGSNCRSMKINIDIPKNNSNSTAEINETINGVDDFFDQFNNISDEEKSEVLSEAATSISQLEESLINHTIPNPCVISESNSKKCSGNGHCSSDNVCICDQGWSLSDCSVSQSAIDQIIEQKENILKKLNETLDDDSIEDPEKRAEVIDQLEKMSDPTFGSKNTSSLVKDIVDKVLDNDGGSGSSLNLTEKEVEQVTKTISNLLYSSAQEACSNGTDTELKQEMSQDIESYLNAIGENAIENSKEKSNTTVSTDAFDLFTTVVSKCDIKSGQGIKMSENSAEIFLSLNEENPDCSELVKIKYYAFQEDLFSCNMSIGSKDSVILEVEDENGNKLNEKFSVGIKYNDKDRECDSGCNKDSDGICQCSNLELFDVGGQIGRIFTNSKIGDLGNIDALKNWKFLEDQIFYIVTGITMTFLMQLMLVNSALKNFCIIEKFRNSRTERGCCWKFIASFGLANAFLNAFLFKDIIFPKSLRATIYYMRVMLMLTFSALFKSSDGLNKQGEFHIDPYLIGLPILTVYPIQFLLGLFLKPTAGNKTSSSISAKRAIGKFLTFCVSGGCIYSIFLVAATNTDTEAAKWTFDFAFIMVQDWILFPLLILLFQRGLSRYVKRAKKEDKSFEGFIKRNLVNENQDMIYQGAPAILPMMGQTRQSISESSTTNPNQNRVKKSKQKSKKSEAQKKSLSPRPKPRRKRLTKLTKAQLTPEKLDFSIEDVSPREKIPLQSQRKLLAKNVPRKRFSQMLNENFKEDVQFKKETPPFYTKKISSAFEIPEPAPRKPKNRSSDWKKIDALSFWNT